MKVVVLGASGMLGNAMYRTLTEDVNLDVYGTARSSSVRQYFSPEMAERILTGVDVENLDSLERVFTAVKPQIVVNCVGLVKQLSDAYDPLIALPINSILPHRLARLCDLVHARLVHISSDCVFAGTKGNYKESDASDAEDLYGQSKYLGEVAYSHTITLRTSIIGHELTGSRSLLGWFLSQEGTVKGYKRAIFSGLPTAELARVVRDIVLPRPNLSGLYHVASEPISKCDLLNLVAEVYGKAIHILPDESVVIDRTLDGEQFRAATGYIAPSWPELVRCMFDFK